ncbi:MAG: flagellar motor protein MotB [Proteobacteria bacterium]|nr:flagellar motor protein MotB [Pseudomonadota bacterium]
MTEPIHRSQPTRSDPFHDQFSEASDLPANNRGDRPASDYINIERRSQFNTVFLVDDPHSASIMPKPTHWSVAWSDLMMTMFVLFLSMYVYQMANQEFLAKKKPEIIGGDTTEALQTLDSSKATFPFSPIRPGLPLITAGTLKKIERITDDLNVKSPPSPTPSPEKKPADMPEEMNTAEKASINVYPETIALSLGPEQITPAPLPVPPMPLPEEDVLGPNPIVPGESTSSEQDKFQEIYRLSKDALDNNNLSKFAAIDIVPDKTMRIILTGDLLFDLGESELSKAARDSLQKVTAAIRYTPYMINVVGHTDNIPMRSSKFKSNWELSVARASSVVHYLIEEAQMDPNQFVVSGYSSYRPVGPNTTAENRAKNRRVEIIISRRLPDPLPASAENLK